MRGEQRFVVDTNLLVSRLLLPGSASARVVRCAMERGTLLFSEDTLTELAEVLSRPKFVKYISTDEVRQFLLLLYRIGEKVTVTRRVHACRDPKDDKFLELALNGLADAIVTGDKDLLEMNPYLGVPILSSAEFITLSS